MLGDIDSEVAGTDVGESMDAVCSSTLNLRTADLVIFRQLVNEGLGG